MLKCCTNILQYITELCVLSRTWNPVTKADESTIQKLEDTFDTFYECVSWFCDKTLLNWGLMKWFRNDVSTHIITCLDVSEVKDFIIFVSNKIILDYIGVSLLLIKTNE